MNCTVHMCSSLPLTCVQVPQQRLEGGRRSVLDLQHQTTSAVSSKLPSTPSLIVLSFNFQATADHKDVCLQQLAEVLRE
jgi:hypothetical protein